MIYPEHDLLTMWKVFNKISLTVFSINFVYFIDQKWKTLYYVEYLSILFVCCILIKEKYIKKQAYRDRIVLIYLLHILFISPLFYTILCNISWLFYFGLLLSVVSYFFSFHTETSRVARVLSCFCYSLHIKSIKSVNGFNIAFIFVMYCINKYCNRNILVARAVSLSLNILSSNLSVFLSVKKTAIWELFATVIAPGILAFLYQKKHKIQEKRKQTKHTQRKYLFLPEK